MGEMMDMEVEILEEKRGVEVVENKKSGSKEGSGSGSVVRWEKFLPRMVVRVLLVEADDSTRQIISALLRKCSYKVAAVPDGLKAWEVLKGRSNNFDLILTEVDLPSISGFALLTLIMEHEICKNIPVIMMSSQDSISMVYKCMLRGAADYLVKPIRINELKNLWQHVWRRQSQFASGALGHQGGTAAEQKAEATAENNAAGSHSTGSKVCSRKQEDIVKKGSDESSCTKADLEAESANMEERGNIPQQNLGEKSFMHQTVPKDSNVQNAALEWQTHREVPNHLNVTSQNSDAVGNSSREAINLIGAFVNNTWDTFEAPPANNGPHEYDSSQLDLSLRRINVGGSENNTNERHILNHSGASAFSRYIYKPLQPMRPTAVSVCNSREGKNSASDHLPDKTISSDSDTVDAEPPNVRSRQMMPAAHKDKAEVAFPQGQLVFPGPPLLHGSLRLDNLSTGYGSIAPPTSSPMRSSSFASQQESSARMNSFSHMNIDSDAINSVSHHSLHDQSPKASLNHTIGIQTQAPAQNLNSMDQRTHFCSPTDQSGSSSLSNAGANHLNKATSAITNPAAAPMCVPENGVEEGFIAHTMNSERSSRREAALNKFRMKRKERCYEKKVRYESRKKLAEQRPRIKGQFVRQVPPDPPPSNSETSWGNSSGG